MTLTAALALAGASLAARKAFPAHLSEERARLLLAASVALVVVVCVVVVLRRLAPRAGSVALDRHHRLHGRLTNALAFLELPPDQRTALMEAAIDDACDHAKDLSARRAAPIAWPPDLLPPALCALGVIAIASLEIRTRRPPVAQAPTIDALAMTPDDLELFRDAAKAMEREDQSPEVKAALERYNQLIEDLANKRLDRTEAFRRMEAIERELLKGAEADRKSLEDALRETGLDLKRSSLSKPIGEALEKKDLPQAKKDLAKLSEKLRDAKQKVDKAELDRLRDALKKASERRKEALAALNDKRSELREQLLKKKQQPSEDPKQRAEDERLLKKKERELERLDREAEQKERTGRQLDRLDRELAKAAEDLMRDLGMSAEDLERAAEDINRLEEQELSDKEKEELRQRLEELRETLRQQGQGGQKRMARMLKFGKRARGQSGGGQRGEGDEQGQGKPGQEGEEGDEGEGQEGKGQGQGKKPGDGQEWVIGPGGKKILVPGSGKGQQPGGGPPGGGQPGGGEGDKPGGQGDKPGQGKQAGTGAGGPIAGDKTHSKMGTQDVQAQAVDAQQGPSNSEVILSAAERGFKGEPYKKVFTKYHTVAEEQIEREKIPDGYRSYVQRYFQLIRPRE